jgi:hypothetical protein
MATARAAKGQRHSRRIRCSINAFRAGFGPYRFLRHPGPHSLFALLRQAEAIPAMEKLGNWAADLENFAYICLLSPAAIAGEVVCSCPKRPMSAGG